MSDNNARDGDHLLQGSRYIFCVREANLQPYFLLMLAINLLEILHFYLDRHRSSNLNLEGLYMNNIGVNWIMPPDLMHLSFAIGLGWSEKKRKELGLLSFFFHCHN